MDNMKDIVSSVIGKLSLRQSFEHDKLEAVWKNILDSKEYKHTQIQNLSEGILTILVDSPAWLYQMKIKKNTLLNRLKEEDFDIKSMVFKIGKVR